MKIAYLGYDLFFPCLQALAGHGCDVMEVYSFPTDNEFEFNREVRGFARACGARYTQRPITLEDIHRLRDAGCEAVFCAGYIYRVPVDHTLPLVNVHPALLPVGRGAWPMPVTILRQMPESGVTLHKMEAEFDTGDILLQRAVPVGADENLETLTRALQMTAAQLCGQAAGDFHRLWANARPQGEGEYWPEPQQRDYTITRDTPPELADRILRAFYGYDCHLWTGQREYRLVRGRFQPLAHSRPFGTVEEGPAGGRWYYITGGVIVAPAGGI